MGNKISSKQIILEFFIVLFGIFYALELTTVTSAPYNWRFNFPQDMKLFNFSKYNSEAQAMLFMYLIPVIALIVYIIVISHLKDFDMSKWNLLTIFTSKPKLSLKEGWKIDLTIKILEIIYFLIQIVLTIIVGFSPSFAFHKARAYLLSTNKPIYYTIDVDLPLDRRTAYIEADKNFLSIYPITSLGIFCLLILVHIASHYAISWLEERR